ncbi:GNAT family N-acetyltransferase [Streptomyces smyrnaeus]|uniref:GNAT family N-acetyltransferase n=1 Tax=Streptomyces smyrnaeus TaxID=1387713 RepID=UPI0036940B97
MPPEVTYELHEGQQAALALLDAFLPAYEEVYAEPPYNEGPRDIAEFIEHYRVHAGRAGFRIVLAREGSEVVGFTYGFLLPADTGWWASIDQPLPEDFVREDGHRTWVVIELAVRKPWRRRGVATGLHGKLLEGLDVERVTLTMRPEPEAAPAQAAYANWGYRKVGIAHPWDEAPFYDAMVRELR